MNFSSVYVVCEGGDGSGSDDSGSCVTDSLFLLQEEAASAGDAYLNPIVSISDGVPSQEDLDSDLWDSVIMLGNDKAQAVLENALLNRTRRKRHWFVNKVRKSLQSRIFLERNK